MIQIGSFRTCGLLSLKGVGRSEPAASASDRSSTGFLLSSRERAMSPRQASTSCLRKLSPAFADISCHAFLLELIESKGWVAKIAGQA